MIVRRDQEQLQDVVRFVQRSGPEALRVARRRLGGPVQFVEQRAERPLRRRPPVTRRHTAYIRKAHVGPSPWTAADALVGPRHATLTVFLQAVFFVGEYALVEKAFGLQVPHAGFDGFEVFGRLRT